ncbi:MAG: hypothetical protein AAFS12_18460, partial [Cyanobacteria bacterium J06632_19]
MATYLSYIENRRDFPLYLRNFAIDHPKQGEWLQVKPRGVLKYSDLTKADRQKHIISPYKDKPIVIHFNQNYTFAIWQQDKGIYGKGWDGPTSDRPITDFSSYQNLSTPYTTVDCKEAHLCLCSDGEDFSLIIDRPMGTVDGVGFLRLHSLHLDGGLSNYQTLSLLSIGGWDVSGTWDDALDWAKDRKNEAEDTVKRTAQSLVWDHLDELESTISRELNNLEHTISRAWGDTVKEAKELYHEAEKVVKDLGNKYLRDIANDEINKIEKTLGDIKDAWNQFVTEETKEFEIVKKSLKNGDINSNTIIAVKKMICAILETPIGNEIKDKFSGIGLAWNVKGDLGAGLVGEYGVGFNIWSLVENNALQ